MNMHTTAVNSGELFWFKGTLVNVRLSWNTGEDRVSVVEHYMPYGKSPPLHIHRNEDEVFHILEGSMLIHIDGKESVAQAGETVLAPKGVPHSFRVESRDGARCLTITSGGDLENMIREMGEPALNAGSAATGRADAGDDRGADGSLREERHRHHRRLRYPEPSNGRQGAKGGRGVP